MEIVFVTVIGAALGGIVRYAVPGRRAYGLGLIPAVGAAVTASVWAILVWFGWTFDGGWIWAVSIAAGVVASVAVAVVIPRVRATSDEHRLHQLSGGRA